MAEQPAKDGKDVKDVFAEEDDDKLEDQHVVDEAEEAEQKAGTEDAVAKAGTEDIEIVLAEEEKEEQEPEAEPEVEPTEEEGEQEPEGEVEEEPDADLKSYSKKVQDRIARERRLVKRAREEADAAVSNERSLRIEAERRSLAAHKNLTEVLLVNIDSQIKAKTAEILAAKEIGESAKEVEVQGELDDLRAKKRDIEGAKASLENQAAEFERNAEAAKAAKAAQVTPAAQDWLGRNRWFGRKGFAAETLMARSIDNKLATERSDKASPEYFAELNRRIRQEMPDLVVKVKRVLKPQTNQPAVRSAVAPVSRSSASVRTDAAGKRRVTLDKVDIQTMRDHKLDPTNPRDVNAFAREKLALNL